MQEEAEDEVIWKYFCGVWLSASYINRSYLSNVHCNFIGDLQVVHAAYDIPPNTPSHPKSPDRGSHEETQKEEKESGEGSLEMTTGVAMIARYISSTLALWKIATMAALLGWKKISKFPSSGFEPFSPRAFVQESTIPN